MGAVKKNKKSGDERKKYEGGTACLERGPGEEKSISGQRIPPGRRIGSKCPKR